MASDRVNARLVITVFEGGAMSVEGPIEQKAWALAVLEQAKQAVKDHHLRREGKLVVPAKDVTITRLE